MSTAPYGSWVSTLSIDDLTSGSTGLGAPTIDDGRLYWLESRADQGGRSSLWRRDLSGGEAQELTPAPAYLRDRVHEYGGGEYAVAGGELVYSEFSDGRLYRLGPDGSATAITPPGSLRYADIRVHPDRSLVLAVREDHGGAGEAENTIVALDLAGPNADGGAVLCRGADFYSTPELSRDGRLAWTQWDHPNMPWDSTEIRVAPVGTDGGWRLAGDPVVVAGGPGESAVAPRWLPDGRLAYVSDRTDWWNLYAWSDGVSTPLHPTDAEFCGPQWVLGQTPYAVLDDDHLLCTLNRSGAESLAVLTLSTSDLRVLTEPGVAADAIAVGHGRVAAVLSFADRPAVLALADLTGPSAATPDWEQVRVSSATVLDPASVSRAQAVSWPGEAGEVHGWFYPPRNAEVTAPAGTLPPLVTVSHGGPTSFSPAGFRLAYQFWTTRGYAILDVNYGGSTGYGRAYRDRLQGRWGLVDVADCAAGAEAMGDRGLADPQRLAVKGGSAGGYTTLRALTSTRTFAAGISQYGVGDLEALATDTHKFESRYLDGLVGPYPQDKAVYDDRSPIHHVDELAAPILLLQGTDDQVVPLNQAEEMAAAARAKGLPVALLVFEGEGHGFRRSETIRASIEAQQSFLGQLFGFVPADDLPVLAIDNLPGPPRA
ncbi:MAG: peptidase prolyl oligopeptidase active site domain protein [Friedmanniella sp.]|nr:peptidase prolyl oligopeptidase active site domain protein [Friedmanniella sp.]